MTVHVAQISDTHLSEAKPFFNANFERLGEALRTAKPDLVINSGDISLDGADLDADLRRGHSLHAALGLDWLAIPGNHDIGDSQGIGSKEPIDARRRDRYRAVFGEDYWTHDIPGWRLIGVNAQLAGSDLAADSDQSDFVRHAAATANGRSIALFVHKPLYDVSPTETELGGRFLPPAARGGLLSTLNGAALRLVACGHVHQFRDTKGDGWRDVWAPSTAFILPDFFQPVFGSKVVGYVDHAFHADGTVDSRLVLPPGMALHNIETIPEAYGDLRARKH
ncbi:MAG: metallophosphoesterase [Alphaproteobacteria bacterium]|nr:metallophosphoesterase [Alphaproteobacteria bacterium]